MPLRDSLLRQFDTAWKLTSYHLDGLTTEECLWRPALRGLHIYDSGNGQWRVDWPESEGYEIGPASIGWLSWHMIFWWSMAVDHSFGDATLARDRVVWPGSAEGVRKRLTDLHDRWHSELDQLSEGDLESTARTRWPMRERPFGDVAAWVNIELMKNAAEIGYARFLYAVRAG
ncbi:hypothetical protein HNQ60_004328 [Povalibacter uvarum]|uniref:DinB-like domain-containing protein n=1 Tax=Povalibacter uvarum TaxID=732238 RepID=A0A841HTW8_9GAMM|nr:DinB family protein [Povalibacter uvarum]MBB6095438.1 hypothetical protein [Povalibacter uvarum]